MANALPPTGTSVGNSFAFLGSRITCGPAIIEFVLSLHTRLMPYALADLDSASSKVFLVKGLRSESLLWKAASVVDH